MFYLQISTLLRPLGRDHSAQTSLRIREPFWSRPLSQHYFGYGNRFDRSHFAIRALLLMLLSRHHFAHMGADLVESPPVGTTQCRHHFGYGSHMFEATLQAGSLDRGHVDPNHAVSTPRGRYRKLRLDFNSAISFLILVLCSDRQYR